MAIKTVKISLKTIQLGKTQVLFLSAAFTYFEHSFLKTYAQDQQKHVAAVWYNVRCHSKSTENYWCHKHYHQNYLF